jgi:hypothetical protein
VNETVRIRLEAIPAHQQVENSHRKGQTSLEVVPNTVHHLFEMADGGQHGEHGFDDHAFIVGIGRTRLQIGGIACFGMKAQIGEDHGAILIASDQRLKGGVMDVGGVTLPIDHLTEMVEQETQLAPHNPAPIGQPFPANLLLRATFANRMDQLNPVTVDHTQQTGGTKKRLVQS